MEKKQLYTAPTLRFIADGIEENFLTSLDGGIDPWIPDDGELEF